MKDIAALRYFYNVSYQIQSYDYNLPNPDKPEPNRKKRYPFALSHRGIGPKALWPYGPEAATLR